MFRSTKSAIEMTGCPARSWKTCWLANRGSQRVDGYLECSQRPNDVSCGQHWLRYPKTRRDLNQENMERNLHWIAPWRSTGIYNIKVCRNSGDPTAHKPKRSRSKTASWQEFSMQKQKHELKETLPISLGFLFKRLVSSWKFYCWNIFIRSLFLHLVKQS